MALGPLVWWPPTGAHDNLVTVMSSTERTDLEDRLRDVGRYADTTTPADGHCLFHALRKEGATDLGHVALREKLFTNASTEDEGALATAAVLVSRTAEDYKRALLSNLYGDHFAIITAAKALGRAICVVAPGFTRTWLPNGEDVR